MRFPVYVHLNLYNGHKSVIRWCRIGNRIELQRKQEQQNAQSERTIEERGVYQQGGSRSGVWCEGKNYTTRYRFIEKLLCRDARR